MEENFSSISKTKSFEKTVDRLEEVVKLLEKGDAPLDESMALFREGAVLIASCEKMLDEAEQVVSSVDISGADIGEKGRQVEMIFDVDEDLTEILFDDSDEEDDEY